MWKGRRRFCRSLFAWLRASDDRDRCLGTMLPAVDFQSLSRQNLESLRLFAQSLGGSGFVMQKGAETAIRKRVAMSDTTSVRPKRRCLGEWSAELGAHAGGEKIHLKDRLASVNNFCRHDGRIYVSDSGNRRIVRWKPGTDKVQVVAGQGAQVNGVNDLGDLLVVGASPSGEILVDDFGNDRCRLVKLEHGHGRVLIEQPGVPFFSPNGVLYVLKSKQVVQRLDGATLRPVMNSDDLPEGQQFEASRAVATKDEVIFLSDMLNNRIVRFRPGESDVTIVGTAAAESLLMGLTLYGDTVYVADAKLKKIWSFWRGESVARTAFDLSHIDEARPIDVLVQDGSLYVLHRHADGGFVTQHPLPAQIDLELAR